MLALRVQYIYHNSMRLNICLMTKLETLTYKIRKTKQSTLGVPTWNGSGFNLIVFGAFHIYKFLAGINEWKRKKERKKERQNLSSARSVRAVMSKHIGYSVDVAGHFRVQ